MSYMKKSGIATSIFLLAMIGAILSTPVHGLGVMDYTTTFTIPFGLTTKTTTDTYANFTGGAHFNTTTITSVEILNGTMSLTIHNQTVTTTRFSVSTSNATSVSVQTIFSRTISTITVPTLTQTNLNVTQTRTTTLITNSSTQTLTTTMVTTTPTTLTNDPLGEGALIAATAVIAVMAAAIFMLKRPTGNRPKFHLIDKPNNTTQVERR